jgi:cell division transport system ATP-binding protein
MGIMGLLEQINETGTTIVMVTHARDIVNQMNKRIIAIESGHIVRDDYGKYGFPRPETAGTSRQVTRREGVQHE